MKVTGQASWDVTDLGEAAVLLMLNSASPDVTCSLAHNLASRIRARRPVALLECVPTCHSILLTFNPVESDAEQLLELLKDCSSGQTEPWMPGKAHIIEVYYGDDCGPDLESVAKICKLTARELITLHTADPYRVRFLGFLPGFGYLGPMDDRLILPRRSTPRPSVPRGSVALAAGQTGVYPVSSPGGWHLLGRTGTSFWDPGGVQPSLLVPGDTVRFRQISQHPQVAANTEAKFKPATQVLLVLESGLLTMLQDQGRAGYAHFGLGAGGSFDADAAVIANALVGNSKDEAVLEVTGGGLRLQALTSVLVALSGADMRCHIDSRPVPPNLAWFLRGGSQLSVRGAAGPKAGARTYIAIAGGFDAPVQLESRSTAMLAQFGGYGGRPLKPGDILGQVRPVRPDSLSAGRWWPGPRNDHFGSQNLRFVRVQGPVSAGEASYNDFVEAHWRISEKSNRMGIRLQAIDGSKTSFSRPELESFGVPMGAIQLPPGGDPIVLGVDHQTTGGYPLVGVVAQVDFPLLAQLSPGDEVNFSPVSPKEARDLYRASVREFQRLIRTLPVTNGP